MSMEGRPMLNCRIWPNGEFSIWDQSPTLAIKPPPECPDYLGLSLLPNSHREALGLVGPKGDRKKRGSSGITPLGSRTVRNAAYLLQERHGIKNLGFYTFTLPPTTDCDEYLAGMEWSEILRIFFQSVGRLLKAAALPTSYVACTEIQEKRHAAHGGLPLHLHVVFVGRKPGGGWAIASDQWRALWRRAVVSRCPAYGCVSFAASTDTARLKTSAEGYLGKYLTKGRAAVSLLLSRDPALEEFLPSTWWNCSMGLKRAIGKRITGGISTAGKLIRDIRQKDTRVGFSREILVELAMGERVPVAIIGKLSAEGRGRYCWREGGVRKLDKTGPDR